MPNPAMSPEREYDRLHTALQLVREALEFWTADQSTVDIREWAKTATCFLDEFGLAPKAEVPARKDRHVEL